MFEYFINNSFLAAQMFKSGLAWWHMPVTQALRRWRQVTRV